MTLVIILLLAIAVVIVSAALCLVIKWNTRLQRSLDDAEQESFDAFNALKLFLEGKSVTELEDMLKVTKSRIREVEDQIEKRGEFEEIDLEDQLAAWETLAAAIEEQIAVLKFKEMESLCK